MPVAFDWFGRQFAVIHAENLAAHVLVFDVGWGEIMNTDASLESLLDQFVADGDLVLNAETYEHVRQSDPAPLHFGECYGYRQPLFPGGENDASNIERTDLSVYWGVVGQILGQLKRKHAAAQ